MKAELSTSLMNFKSSLVVKLGTRAHNQSGQGTEYHGLSGVFKIMRIQVGQVHSGPILHVQLIILQLCFDVSLKSLMSSHLPDILDNFLL